ncbi:Oar protein [Xanthomonas phaseoli pv. phaseoli]|uniref:Oar protein n=1 Tax=Xanthomonas campestris pv. phaseoli TaxID=317013 RepID=A0AB34QKH4_XANCH|nr:MULTISPECIES: TonB-dependent receptor [Xanthomonas]ATS21839.1 TonB-dependent receptor [Xanthomonas phaseoli pv. phaseoli]ATS24647.1 TonB-dependent receptor [Xanthomonas phaseoli pv. phaseoli]ATS32965.1 TonB-dependent receptor [Xanthomonas phaseoli pv. phaseoli]AZU13785.1 Oar protein [Xanthomonas phaseoli pv. phaseoli]AZU26550.1 Oar protein [Xanthomonas phaseoli pv. phaseoli]
MTSQAARQRRSFRSTSPARYGRISMLALALSGAVGMLATGTAAAQSTTAGIYGSAPASAGATVTAQSDTGLTRTATVDANGRYAIGNLPVGTYTVTLQREGQAAETRKNIALRVGAGTDVSFGSSSASDDTATLGTITVTGKNISPVDVSATASRTVITAEQLQRLPLARSGEAIALLSPGAVQGSGYFGNAISFGGAGVTENAYYLNGYLSSNPLTNIGGVTLPYGAIDQQETYTGGYSARYGRSAGGVLSQVGKRGTNEWHFGGQMLWRPKSLSSDYKNVFYPDTAPPSSAYGYSDPTLPGTLYRSRKGDQAWNTVYSAYAGGPLIEDRLFVFIAAEQERTEGVSTARRDDPVIGRNNYRQDEPKVYAKIDWNINDSNVLEFTGVKNNYRESGVYSAFNGYDGVTSNADDAFADTVKVNDRYYIGKYTSYITDALTFSATYGKSQQSDYRNNPSTNPYLYSANLQDPAVTGGNEIRNNQTSSQGRDGENRTHGLRLDLEYALGAHTLAAGVDNMYFNADNEGVVTTGPGYTWTYGNSSRPDLPISGSLGVGPAGGDGYYVYRGVYNTSTSMSVRQKAYFLEDKWQVTNNLLLTLGVRNDKFTNFNDAGTPYVESGDQWAPRLGLSWDVFGDSSFKVYGNAGRYYLALPNSVAIRGASPSTYTREYFNYTGIDAQGNPTGLTPIAVDPSAGFSCGGNVVSSNQECGQPTDSASVAARDLKSMYQDEFMVGFDKTLGSDWVTGAKFTYRNLGTAIDDVCDSDKMRTKLTAIGVDPSTVNVPGCVIFNPSETNSFSLANLDGSGRTALSMSSADWGFDKKAKRKYLALDLFLQHPFDGKWEGRIDYTLSRNFGNTEGQVKSDIGQTDVSKTQDWDAAALMWYSGGDLANDRRHQIKIYGSYQIAPEWLVAGNIRILSGTPRSCLGYVSTNGTDESSDAGDPVGYGSAYHICNGQPSRPGDASRMPWTKIVDLGLTYRPAFADKKLAVTLQGFNIFNERKPLQVDSTWEDSPYTLSNTYGMGVYFTQPRYAVLSVSYDY